MVGWVYGCLLACLVCWLVCLLVDWFSNYLGEMPRLERDLTSEGAELTLRSFFRVFSVLCCGVSSCPYCPDNAFMRRACKVGFIHHLDLDR